MEDNFFSLEMPSLRLKTSISSTEISLPVTAVAFLRIRNEILHSCGNVVISQNFKIRLDTAVVGMRCYDSRLLVFERHNISVYDVISDCEPVLCFSHKMRDFIFDVMISGSDVFVLTGRCAVYKLSDSKGPILVFKADEMCVVCAKFVLDGIAIGTFNKLCITPLSFLKSENHTETLENLLFRAFGERNVVSGREFVYTFHKGRIFDVLYHNGSIYTCAEDRTIAVNGERLIQSHYNYFYDISVHDNRVYGCNKDGYLYVCANNEVFYKIKCGIVIIEAIEGDLYVGFKNGELLKITENQQMSICDKSLMNKCASLHIASDEENTYNLHRNYCTIENKEGIRKIEIDTIFEKRCRKSPLSLASFDKNGTSSDFDHKALRKSVFTFIKILGNSLVLFNSEILIKLCRRCHGITEAIALPKICCVAEAGIGTKRGWVYSGGCLLKISNFPIHSIVNVPAGADACNSGNNWVKAVDSSRTLHIFMPNDGVAFEYNTSVCGSNLKHTKTLKRTSICENPELLSKIWFNNFTAQQTINCNQDIGYCDELIGTGDGYLFYLEKRRVCSVLFLDREINHIYAICDTQFFVATKTGKIFIIRKIASDIFIECDKSVGSKIVGGCGMQVLLSDGRISEFGGDLALIKEIRTGKYNTCSAGDFVFSRTAILHLKDGAHTEHCVDIGTVFSSFVLCTENQKKVYFAGDFHKIFCFSIGESFGPMHSVIAHTAPIKSICSFNGLIFSVGMDFRVCIFTETLDLVECLRCSISNPRVLRVNKKCITVYGDGIEDVLYSNNRIVDTKSQ